MTDASPDVTRLAGAVAGLFDGPITDIRPPAWRAWESLDHYQRWMIQARDASQAGEKA
jgi:hypothetical protein